MWHNPDWDIRMRASGWSRYIRLQDFVWPVLFAVLAATSDILDVYVLAPLAALAVAQILEPKIHFVVSPRGRILWIVVKLALGYVLIGYTRAIVSTFWLVLLLPVVSAATAFGLIGTLVFTFVAGIAYLSFLSLIHI